MWNLKTYTNDLIYKTEIDPQTKKTSLWLPKWKQKGKEYIKSLHMHTTTYNVDN